MGSWEMCASLSTSCYIVTDDQTAAEKGMAPLGEGGDTDSSSY